MDLQTDGGDYAGQSSSKCNKSDMRTMAAIICFIELWFEWVLFLVWMYRGHYRAISLMVLFLGVIWLCFGVQSCRCAFVDEHLPSGAA